MTGWGASCTACLMAALKVWELPKKIGAANRNAITPGTVSSTPSSVAVSETWGLSEP